MTSRISTDQIAVIRDAQKDVLKQRLVELEVTEYWGVIFSTEGIQTLTKQDVTGFMSYAQNRRWRDIQKDDVTRDMEKLKRSLSHLIDESSPIATRLNDLEPGRGSYAITHLGKAKLTPLLLVSRPKDYGVWNDYSERAMIAMGIFPIFNPGERLGDQYSKVNAVLVDLAATYRISLWRLDVILEQLARLVR